MFYFYFVSTQGDEAQAQLVIDRHRQALEYLLRIRADSLTLHHIQMAHSRLMGSTEPSQLRRSTAYAGQAEFSRASELPQAEIYGYVIEPYSSPSRHQ